MISHEEQNALLERCNTILLEHCARFVIVADFIPDDPCDVAPTKLAGYGSFVETLGLLAHGTERTKHDLWQEFNAGESESE